MKGSLWRACEGETLSFSGRTRTRNEALLVISKYRFRSNSYIERLYPLVSCGIRTWWLELHNYQNKQLKEIDEKQKSNWLNGKDRFLSRVQRSHWSRYLSEFPLMKQRSSCTIVFLWKKWSMISFSPLSSCCWSSVLFYNEPLNLLIDYKGEGMKELEITSTSLDFSSWVPINRRKRETSWLFCISKKPLKISH